MLINSSSSSTPAAFDGPSNTINIIIILALLVRIKCFELNYNLNYKSSCNVVESILVLVVEGEYSSRMSIDE